MLLFVTPIMVLIMALIVIPIVIPKMSLKL